MTQPSPAETLRAAAERLRGHTSVGAYTATPAGAALLRAREPLAELLGTANLLVVKYPELGDDHDRDACNDFTCDLTSHALAVARAILGEDQT